MIKLQFTLQQTLISRGFTRRTVLHVPTVTRTTARGTTSSTFTPVNSCTQRCYCHGSPNDTHTPDKDSYFTLTRAGLGFKKIKFSDKNETTNILLIVFVVSSQN